MPSCRMLEDVTKGEFQLGVEGIAVLRHILRGERGALDRRIGETRALLEEMERPPWSDRLLDLGERDPSDGYAGWAARYDDPANPFFSLDGPLIEGWAKATPKGRILDAACGTGRIAEILRRAGHDVVGVDITRAMLARAATRLPGAPLCQGDVRSLPVRDGAFDGAACVLALTHLEDLRPALAELARVLRPGGRLLLVDVHPFAVLVGWMAFLRTEEGVRTYVRNHLHLPSSYLDAARRAGLAVVACREIPFSFEDVETPEPAAMQGWPALICWDLEKTGTTRSP